MLNRTGDKSDLRQKATAWKKLEAPITYISSQLWYLILQLEGISTVTKTASDTDDHLLSLLNSLFEVILQLMHYISYLVIPVTDGQ